MFNLPRNAFVLMLSLMLVVKEGKSLQCFECMSAMGIGHADCESNPSLDYLRECVGDEKYCSTITAEAMGIKTVIKNCSVVDENTPYECVSMFGISSCHGAVSCATDACNNHGISIFTFNKVVVTIVSGFMLSFLIQ